MKPSIKAHFQSLDIHYETQKHTESYITEEVNSVLNHNHNQLEVSPAKILQPKICEIQKAVLIMILIVHLLKGQTAINYRTRGG